jgi:CHASE2 domain-containing sensor protein
MKILIALAFVGILGALATAGVFMLRDGRDGKPKTGNMMRALAVRVTLSVLLFACILLAYWAGWIQPTGIPIGK